MNTNYNMWGFVHFQALYNANSWSLIMISDLEHRIWLGNWSSMKVNIQKSISSICTNSFQLQDVKEDKTPFTNNNFKKYMCKNLIKPICWEL